jgi:hypothetical protein
MSTNPNAIQFPRDMEVLLTGTDAEIRQNWCKIADFAEETDIVNVSGEYEVKYRVCRFRGELKTVTRSFQTKTAADNFVLLLQGIPGAQIVSGSTYKARLLFPTLEGMRLVKPNGTVDAQAQPLGDL